MSEQRKRFADLCFLAALMLYILVGVALVPPHGDEYMLMAMGRDAFYLSRGDWDRVLVTPPLQVDTEPYLRVINGTISKTLIGCSWLLSGRTEASLPGIYAWGMSQQWNIEQGNVPTDDNLHFARWSSALLTALGVFPAFALGWLLRLRSMAYPLTLLYALHPVILINGRRAMMEGSLFFFSLLTIAWLAAVIVAEHSATAESWLRRIPAALRYGSLGVFAGMTVAAKQTGIIVLATVLISLVVTEVINRRLRRAIWSAALTGIIALTTWFAMNPGYWRDPVGVLAAALEARGQLLAQQASDPLLAYADIGQRIAGLITQPFMQPAQYYEAPTWADLIDPQIADYEASSVSGWHWGTIIGGALTLLAGVGLLMLVRDALRRDLLAVMILVWAGIAVASALTVPLAWQRYYLPLTLLALLLAAVGMAKLLVRREVASSPAPLSNPSTD
ncbi:MAG: hypothetical protein KF726_21800 [Anaerolineae bacterium]|nr:hypothetical protein [Anaerolineae bacterium]